MPSKKLLHKYAEVAVKVGANVQKGQPLMISANVDTKEFTRVLVEEAYKAGASNVSVRYNDEVVNHHNYEYCDLDVLGTVPNYIVDQFNYYIEKGYALISVHAETPGLMADIEPIKIQTAAIANNKALKSWRDHTMGNRTQWCVISVPTAGWAKRVFPEFTEELATDALWEAIFNAVRVHEDNDPVSEWEKHNEILHRHNEALNEHNFKSLHFKNSLGTDLVVELVKNHVWAGGNEKSTKGVVFNPNMPTEETFTMPFKFGVNGRVYASKPLNYNGNLIRDFWLEFKEGKVVDYDAKEAKESLKSLLEFDEGSSYLGEVALISHDSPISNSDILFLNTLFDENASCHLALGRAYPMNVKGGNSMTQAELDKLGSNNSMEHEDFMFGSVDMSIIGLTQDGKEVVVFKDGNFAF
jgi:aminopeptidase